MLYKETVNQAVNSNRIIDHNGLAYYWYLQSTILRLFTALLTITVLLDFSLTVKAV